MDVHIHTSGSRSWTNIGEIYVYGSAHHNGELLSEEALAEHFADPKNEQEFVSTAAGLNGYFTVIREADGGVWAAVDHLGTTPLFYAASDGDIYVSDEGAWVQERIGPAEPTRGAVAEYALFRFVFGTDTIHPDIQQTRPGQVLVGDEATATWTLRQYYTYELKTPQETDRQRLMDEFDELLVKAFERFLSYVGDRPIVVSLSGGYDSRLILSMLERLGHEDVIAFTCHKGSDEDVELAERIANIAGVPWEYAELSHDDWRRFYESDDWERIHREGNCLSGNVFVFDVLPIQQLEAAGRIPDDAVFVCGHTAVDPARPMNRYLRSERSYSVGQVTDDIIDFHHCQWDFQGDAIESHVRDRIAEEIGTEPFETRRDAVEAYEQWRWRERESKYIVSHHVRVYDYVGHDWWLPLYDQDLLEFWSRVPIDAKGGRELYQRYTERLFSDVFDIPIQEARRTTGSPSLVASVESLVSGTPVKSVASDVYHTYKDIRTSFAAENDKMETYRDDPRLGIVGERTYQKACDVAEHFEGFHSMAELDLVSFDDPASSRIPRDGVFAWDAPPLADFAEAEDGTQSK